MSGVHASNRRGFAHCGDATPGREQANVELHPDRWLVVTCQPCRRVGVEAWADEIMEDIRNDIASDHFPGLEDARSFSDLHDYVDANEYLQGANVPWVSNAVGMDLVHAVEDEVSRRLQRGELRTVAVAVYVTSRFSFMATGVNEAEARRALRAAWQRHCTFTGANPLAFVDSDVNVLSGPIGSAFRDGSAF